MNPAVIVEERECGDLHVFRSRAEAEGYLEAIDVENGEYEAFDAEGFPLTLGVDGRRVKIERTTDAAPQKEEVEAKLRRFVGFAGESLAFDELIVAAEKRSRSWLTTLFRLFERKKNA